MKIIPVASGKGGVGKTTLALNLALALSRRYKTVLIDLDAGTSSLRNFLEMKINQDIYHFLKKDVPIEKCLVPLDRSLDPEQQFAGFRMIASPKNFISEIVNLDGPLKMKLARGINQLQADYVIMDIKAGLDSHVLEFLPINNTGILIFTPQMKAAISTAVELVRAILLRVCRICLSQKASRMTFRDILREKDFQVLNSLIDRLEDSYNRRIKNFDDFFLEVEKRFPYSVIISQLKQFITRFRVYFVLNQFNGVEESAENIIKPFMEKLNQMVSSDIMITNLGWVIFDEEIRRSSEDGLPYLVMQQYRREPEMSAEDRLDAKLRELVGLDTQKHEPIQKISEPAMTNNEVTYQLDILHRMYARGASKDPEANFDFIVARLQALKSSSIHRFGMQRIFSSMEIRRAFYS